MKIGDIVTTEQFGPSVHFCVLAYYIDNETGENYAIIALVEPALIRTAPQKELTKTSLADIFAKHEEGDFIH